jgi:elongator complex protein 6
MVSLSSDINAPPSDLPPGHIPPPLEINTQAFLVGMAHEADLIVGCRGLDTGGAGDVSGVIRITKGPSEQEELNKDWKEQELLYFVKGDGDVKVWERGAGVG